MANARDRRDRLLARHASSAIINASSAVSWLFLLGPVSICFISCAVNSLLLPKTLPFDLILSNMSRHDHAPKMIGKDEPVGEGDAYLVEDLLPDYIRDVAFENLKDEVKWSTMQHHGSRI